MHKNGASSLRVDPDFSMDMHHLGELVGITDLARALVELVAASVAATPSCVALRVTSPALGVAHPIQTVDYDHARSVARASLRLDLLRHNRGPTRRWPMVTVVLFAGTAGAFAAFAAGPDRLSPREFRIVRRTVDGGR